ncbi:MAG: MtnX-like HAD-IB family phosphatase [Thermoplasmatota archaeon]
MGIGIMVDFDGTIAETDASYDILNRFAEGDWLSIEKKAYAHEITILEALRRQAVMVKAGPEKARRFLTENVNLRPGFTEFANYCRDFGIPLLICSDGFGWTIEVLLEHWGLEWIPWVSNRTFPDAKGWRIEFQHRREGCPVNANCKCSHLWKMRERVDKVVFVGDGTTDECVSKEADVVFARDKLMDLCRSNNIECIPWTTWKELLDRIREL